jgi:hypothetical protein
MLKALDIWLPAYLRRSRPSSRTGVVDVLLCVCDHFEPFHHATKSEAMARVELWRSSFPKLADSFRDADGFHPKHTFFYPIEQYDRDLIGCLAELCRSTHCETEIHLHHQDDTAKNLRASLERGKEELASHGLLSRDSSGALRYGFIHGNWALDNSDPHGRHCGVSNELSVLAASGCYADFTMPSAPSRTQTRMINSVYRATCSPAPKSHETGAAVGAGKNAAGDLLIVQGPLGLNWRRRKLGFLPRIENGDLTEANPPTPDRMRIWLDLGIHVIGRPEWVFVKLHTHGAIPANSRMLLGAPMRRFHEQLRQEEGLRLHYVTAREMVNIIHAAEDGRVGNPGEYRDYRYKTLINH